MSLLLDILRYPDACNRNINWVLEDILGVGSANERRHHIVTSYVIDWAHIQNDPSIPMTIPSVVHSVITYIRGYLPLSLAQDDCMVRLFDHKNKNRKFECLEAVLNQYA